MRRSAYILLLLTLVTVLPLAAQQTPFAARNQKIIIDTDIGDDIDDAFAVALALKSPELQILGITTEFGDTAIRANLVDRMLEEAGMPGIPVAVGIHTDAKTSLSQRPYADGGHFQHRLHEQAVEFILNEIQLFPGEITLV